MNRNLGRSSAKKQSSFDFGKNMSGCEPRYSNQAVVPHLGAPTMNRLGIRRGALTGCLSSKGFIAIRPADIRRTTLERVRCSFDQFAKDASKQARSVSGDLARQPSGATEPVSRERNEA